MTCTESCMMRVNKLLLLLLLFPTERDFSCEEPSEGGFQSDVT